MSGETAWEPLAIQARLEPLRIGFFDERDVFIPPDDGFMLPAVWLGMCKVHLRFGRFRGSKIIRGRADTRDELLAFFRQRIAEHGIASWPTVIDDLNPTAEAPTASERARDEAAAVVVARAFGEVPQ